MHNNVSDIFVFLLIMVSHFQYIDAEFIKIKAYF